MNDSVPHLALIHIESVPQDFLSDFTSTVQTDGLKLLVQSRPSVPFAGIEWLMPTAIAAYLAKPYFESFLKEMGMDHYGLLKNALTKLYKRVAGPTAPEVTLLSTAGKVSKEQPYSLFFSVLVEGPDGNRFKLLIPRPINETEYSLAISAFLEFGEQLHSRTIGENTALELKDIPRFGGTALLAYDVSEKRLKVIDPLAGHRR